jgi:ribonuclease HII
MTANEIIKALECCKDSTSSQECYECPYYGCNLKRVCVDELQIDALDLINRLQKDKEYYKNNRNEYQDKVMFISKQCDELQEENNRQKAENERLQNIIKDLIDKKETIVIDLSSVGEVVDVSNSSESRVISVGMLSVVARRARAEAITEFAERLKTELEDSKYATVDDSYRRTCNCVVDYCLKKVDQIAKEMKGEQE